MIKRFQLVLLLIISTVAVRAQLAELDVLQKSISLQEGIYKAREAYNTGNYTAAEALFYAELEKGKFAAGDFLRFANTLAANDKDALAKEFFTEYTKASENPRATLLIAQIASDLNNIRQSARFYTATTFSNITHFNSKYYSSLNGKMMSFDKDCEGNLYHKKEVLQGLTNLEFGSVAFFNDGHSAIASLIDSVTHKSGLFLFTQKKGVWTKPTILVSDEENNYAFPFMDELNQALYFSSDKPGGQGGYDIYVANISGKNIQKSINLGSVINSAGNEINAILNDGCLFMSSNGHVSLGGYDLYKYQHCDDDQAILINCIDFNSKKNDFSIFLDEIQTLVNRIDHDGGSLVTFQEAKASYTHNGTVVNKSEKPIKNAYVIFNNPLLKGQSEFAITDEMGNYSFKTSEENALGMGIVFADGYQSKSFTMSTENTSIILDDIVPVEITKEVIKTVYVPTYRGYATDSLVGDSEAPLRLITDQDGASISNYKQPANKDGYYIILGTAYNYNQAYELWNNWLVNFEDAEILAYENDLYRIGFFAGSTEEQATRNFNIAKEKKKDIWILRPAH